MTRLIFAAFVTALGIGVAVWHSPAWGEEKTMPYTCLPAVEADAIHMARGDVLLAHREQGRFIEFLWQTQEGDFLIVSFDRATFRVCALKFTPHDPRKDRSS